MSILRLLDKPISFHRCLAEIAGSTEGGVFLQQACYWTQRGDKEGWFWKTREQWHEETMLTRTNLETVRKNLKKVGVLEEKMRGMPGKLHFRINEEVLQKCIDSLLPVCRVSANMSAGSYPLVGRILPACRQDPTSHYIETETTTETTTEEGSTLRVEASIQQSVKETKSRKPPRGGKVSPYIENPPTDEQVNAYCFLRGIDPVAAKKQILIWGDGDWKYPKGEPVLNWKQGLLIRHENGWLPGKNGNGTNGNGWHAPEEKGDGYRTKGKETAEELYNQGRLK